MKQATMCLFGDRQDFDTGIRTQSNPTAQCHVLGGPIHKAGDRRAQIGSQSKLTCIFCEQRSEASHQMATPRILQVGVVRDSCQHRKVRVAWTDILAGKFGSKGNVRYGTYYHDVEEILQTAAQPVRRDAVT